MSVEDKIEELKNKIGYDDFKETVDDLIVDLSDNWIQKVIGSSTFLLSYGKRYFSGFKIESVFGSLDRMPSIVNREEADKVGHYTSIIIYDIEKHPKSINNIFEYLDRNSKSSLVYLYTIKLDRGELSDLIMTLKQIQIRCSSEGIILEVYSPSWDGSKKFFHFKDFIKFLKNYNGVPEVMQISFIKEFNEKLIELDKNPELKLPKNIIGEFNDFVKSTRLNKHQKEVLVNIMTKGNWESKIDSN
jgi:hypothetical protein